MKEKINNGFSFYRIKTEWVCEGPKGELQKTKTEELVLASNYTEAEKVAYGIAEDQNRGQFGSFNIEIVKTKITDILFNKILLQDDNTVCGLICNYFEEGEESGVGLYAVKVIYVTINEKTAKEKRTTDTLYVPALSNSDATSRIDAYLKKSMSDFVIRDAKFDKAGAIYWSAETHQNKVKELDLA